MMNNQAHTSNMTEKQGAPSLQALVASIEADTAPFLTKDLQQLREKAKNDAREKSLHITFFLNDIELALPIDSIQEIDHIPTVTPLPNIPAWILGITHVRGDIISMIDLKKLFNLQAASVVKTAYYILLTGKSMKFGFPIDRASGIIGIEWGRDKLSPHPLKQSSSQSDLPTYIKGMLKVGDKDLAILNGQKLLRASLLTDFMA